MTEEELKAGYPAWFEDEYIKPAMFFEQGIQEANK